MDFSYTDKTNQLRTRVDNFMQDHIIPRIGQWREELEAGTYPVSFMEDLKALARDEGLWNLFLPDLRDDEPGTALSNLEYAPLAEIMATYDPAAYYNSVRNAPLTLSPQGKRLDRVLQAIGKE